MEIYVKMYKESKPSADIKKIIKSGEGKKPGWFEKYYLDQDRQIEIIEEIMDKYKINKHIRRKWHSTILLGAAPNSHDKKEIKTKIKTKTRN